MCQVGKMQFRAKRIARKAIGEIAIRAFTVLAANELADAVRETITWLTN